MVSECPADNRAIVEQEEFWNGQFDAHKIGWIISGAAAALTIFISLITIFGHARNYNRPLEQRQIIRILLFAPVFASVSFLSYRFFRSYTYYELAEVAYEAFAIASFLMLLLQYVGDNVEEQVDVFAKKEKRKLPMPFCCWRYRPSKAYFLNLLKWGVIQYIIVRPALSIAGIILEYFELLCTSSYSYKYGEVYLVAVDFVSISIALYALIVLYGLLKEDLKGRRPLAKFMTIKLAIFFTFYQSFVFGVLQDHGVIRGTKYWTATNVADGLNALATSLEMVIVAAFQMWAFPWNEYYVDRLNKDGSKVMPIKANKKGKTSIWRSMFNALNFSDLFVELWHSIRFGFDRMRGKEYTRTDARFGKFDIAAAFGAEGQGNASQRGDQSPLAGVTSRDGRFEMEEHRLGPNGEKIKSNLQVPSSNENYQQRDFVSFDPNSSSGFNSSGKVGNGNTYLYASTPPTSEFTRSSNDSDTLGSLRNGSGYGANNGVHRRRPSFDPHPLSRAIQENEAEPESYNDSSDIGLLNKSPSAPNHGNSRLAPALNLVNLPGQADLGRLSPSPRSPIDSSGRYPSFIYDSENFKNGNSNGLDSRENSPGGIGRGFGSRSSSPNPNFNPGSNGEANGIPRQPNPLQPGSWNETHYRVSGFPRESFIETDSGSHYSNQNQVGNSTQEPQRVHPNALYPHQQNGNHLRKDQQFDSSRQQQHPIQSQTSQPRYLQQQTTLPSTYQSQVPPPSQPPPNQPLPITPLSIPNKQKRTPPAAAPAPLLEQLELLNHPNSESNPSSSQPLSVPIPQSQRRGPPTNFINQTGFRDSLFAPDTIVGQGQRPISVNSEGELEGASSAGHETLKSRPGSWEPQAL